MQRRKTQQHPESDQPIVKKKIRNRAARGGRSIKVKPVPEVTGQD